MGKIITVTTRKERKHQIDKQGYHLVGLWDNGVQKMHLVHRLVLQHFKPCENIDKLQVNHIDGNKDNNCVDNLEWVTDSENKYHAYKTRLKVSWNELPCYAIDENNNLYGQFRNPYDAERETGNNHNTIYASIKLNRRCRNGLKWFRGIFKGGE